jgi:hypothetical protein
MPIAPIVSIGSLKLQSLVALVTMGTTGKYSQPKTKHFVQVRSVAAMRFLYGACTYWKHKMKHKIKNKNRCTVTTTAHNQSNNKGVEARIAILLLQHRKVLDAIKPFKSLKVGIEKDGKVTVAGKKPSEQQLSRLRTKMDRLVNQC